MNGTKNKELQVKLGRMRSQSEYKILWSGIQGMLTRIEAKMVALGSIIPFNTRYYIRKSCAHGCYHSVLELGCGKGIHMGYLKEGLKNRGTSLILGADIWAPYIEQGVKNKTHDQYVLADACLLPFKDKSFDLVLALDLLEHIPKEEGKRLLTSLDRIAKKRVVLSLPLGWHPSHGDKNPYDEHISSWSQEELRSREYRVYSFYIKGAGGQLFESRIPPTLRLFWLGLKLMAGIVTSHFPHWAGYMVAYKEV